MTVSDEGVIRVSTSGRGHSVFASLKKELVHREDYATPEQARATIFEAFCNRARRHSAQGYVAPAEEERTHNSIHR